MLFLRFFLIATLPRPPEPRIGSSATGAIVTSVTVVTVSCVSPITLTCERISSGKPGRARIAATSPGSAWAAPDHSRKSAKTAARGRSAATHSSTLAARLLSRYPLQAWPAIVRVPASGLVARSSSAPISVPATEASWC